MPTLGRHLSFAVTAGFLVVVVVTARSQSLPEGRGRTDFELLCGRCHELERSTRLRLSEEQWAAVVAGMAERGMEGTDDQFSSVVAYLAAHFGPDKPAPLPKVNVNTASAEDLAEVLGLLARDADAIVRHRESQGAFREWADLTKVDGIDVRKLEAQKDRLDFAAPGGKGSGT